jgi:hypothetical protein
VNVSQLKLRNSIIIIIIIIIIIMWRVWGRIEVCTGCWWGSLRERGH